MATETLEDHLRKATRQATARLSEDRVFALGRDLARELAAAHAETPPRHPSLEPADVTMTDGLPRLGTGTPAGDAAEDIFQLGALLTALALGRPAALSWRLDGPPRPDVSSVRRRAVLAGLSSPRPAERYATAAEALAALDGVLAAPVTGDPSWAMFRGDSARSGARPAAKAAGDLRLRWHAAVGSVVSSPVVTGDLVIAVTADGTVVFLDRATGRVLENVALGSAVESSPALASGVLHVGTDDGTLVGIGLADGRERYRTRIGSLVRSSPLVADGLVFAGTIDAKGQGGVAAVTDAGDVKWTRKLAAVFSSPAVAGAVMVVGADDGAVHALDRATGAPAWSRKVGAKVRATPAVDGALVLVAAFDGTIAALRAADGTAAWERALGHTVYSSPAVTNGMAVFGCHDGHVHAVDCATGAVRFQAETGGPVLASPAASGTRVVVASTDGHLYVIDESGAVAHRLLLAGGSTQSSPALDGEDVFVGGGRGVHAVTIG
jgi:outer membrane protein assembly factor BamB